MTDKLPAVFSRRLFLKGGAVLAGGIGAAWQLPGAALGASKTVLPSEFDLDELHLQLLHQSVVEETLRAGLIVEAINHSSLGHEVVRVGDLYAQKEKGLGLIYSVTVNGMNIVPQNAGASAYAYLLNPWESTTITWARKAAYPIPPFVTITLALNARR